jgi:uncharacterized protein YdcH (DUF465 family)
MMNKEDHLNLKHRLLDDQIDELEKKTHHPLPQEKKMIQDLKKERLKIRDEISRLHLEHSHVM